MFGLGLPVNNSDGTCVSPNHTVPYVFTTTVSSISLPSYSTGNRYYGALLLPFSSNVYDLQPSIVCGGSTVPLNIHIGAPTSKVYLAAGRVWYCRNALRHASATEQPLSVDNDGCAERGSDDPDRDNDTSPRMSKKAASLCFPMSMLDETMRVPLGDSNDEIELNEQSCEGLRC